jgi:hypothetical protein
LTSEVPGQSGHALPAYCEPVRANSGCEQAQQRPARLRFDDWDPRVEEVERLMMEDDAIYEHYRGQWERHQQWQQRKISTFGLQLSLHRGW